MTAASAARKGDRPVLAERRQRCPHRPIGELEDLRDDRILDVPGGPLVIRTPGHTAGHYSVALRERGVLQAGDALATVTTRPGGGLSDFTASRTTGR